MKKIFVLIVTALLSANIFAANIFEKQEDKITLKTRKIVENATPDDWKSLAYAASICIANKKNLTQASEWLQKSLSINKNSYNLEVMGDYLLISNLPEEAKKQYVAAMKLGMEQDANYDLKPLQQKLKDLKELQN